MEARGENAINWHEIFEYRDGNLYWKSHKFKGLIGKKAGYKNNPYEYVRFETKAYAVHKIIYEMHHGPAEFPVDHIDRDKTNNRIENLREATKSQNEMNTELRVTNTSGFKGVYFFKKTGRWRVKIDVNGKEKHLGYFATALEGAKAYNEAALKYHGEYAYLNSIPSGDQNGTQV